MDINESSPLLVQLMNSGQFCDFEIVCEEEVFKVHKAIVCFQSPVIEAALKDWKEAETNILRIDSFDTVTVKRMIEFLYTGEYQVNLEERDAQSLSTIQDERRITIPQSLLNRPDDDDVMAGLQPNISSKQTAVLQHHIHVNAIADYFNITKLNQLSVSKIQHILQTNWSAVAFCGVVQEALGSTSDKQLHELVASAAAEHIRELIELDSFSDLESMSTFAINVLRGCDKRIQKLETDLAYTKMELHADLTDQKSLLQQETARAGHIIDNVEKCLRVLSRTESCCNGTCNAEFSCYIEQHGRVVEPLYTLRCAVGITRQTRS
ncbi:hypothetical protein B7463_g11194, partial [Scytalidium lignicola]